MHHKEHRYFGLLGIGNVVNQLLPNPLVVSYLQNLDGSAQGVQNFYDRVRSDMIAKAIEGSITKIHINKIRLHRGGYEWDEAGGIISND